MRKKLFFKQIGTLTEVFLSKKVTVASTLDLRGYNTVGNMTSQIFLGKQCCPQIKFNVSTCSSKRAVRQQNVSFGASYRSMISY